MKLIKNSIITKLIIILTIFALDRFSKEYVVNLFEVSQIQEIYLLDFINIFLIWNEGIAFGLFNFGDKSIYNFMTLLIIIISLIILYLALKDKSLTSYLFSLIFGGSLGNLFDRIKFSAVPDFIDLHIGNYHWFIFNVADIFITLGVICLIFVELFYNKKKYEKN